MIYKTLISASTLDQHINDLKWVIVDCRFSLANNEAGSYAYRHGHIPHARYADLNKDLSSRITDFTGRHPLPDFTLLAKKLGAWGITNDTQVVAYDDNGGAFAGRLWWLLRCLRHEKVAVLDGGIQHWQKQGFSISTTLPTLKTLTYRPYLNTALWLNASQVQNRLAKKAICLIDARTPERYRGEQEPVDPVAGHIPGALNRAFQLNIDNKGLFLSAKLLHDQFKTLIGVTTPEQTVHYCGSGVTACHNLLAMEHAGLTGSKLYAGSWSEWIRDRNREIATSNLR
jgi:thiosulfate/3-mercaptopyruvate sulfurtransferase